MPNPLTAAISCQHCYKGCILVSGCGPHDHCIKQDVGCVKMFFMLYLHPDDSINEEQHGNEKDHIRKGLKEIIKQLKNLFALIDENLKGLNKSPQEDSDCVTLPKKLDEPRSSEQTKKSDIEEVFLKCFVFQLEPTI